VDAGPRFFITLGEPQAHDPPVEMTILFEDEIPRFHEKWEI
jgi:hypothetical protein